MGARSSEPPRWTKRGFGTGINGWLGERQVVQVGGFGRNVYVHGQCVYLGATDAEAMAAAAAAESGAESIAGRHGDSNMLEECEHSVAALVSGRASTGVHLVVICHSTQL
jgi:hypothetical protein